MGLLDLFINNENQELQKKPTPAPQASKVEIAMPTALKLGDTTSPELNVPPPTILRPETPEGNAILAKVKKVYENGFESMNRPGYDFFEYLKAVSAIPNASGETYKMAFMMGKSMAPDITPESLIADAEYYKQKLQEAGNQLESSGKTKLEEIISRKTKAREFLEADVIGLQQKISELQQELDTKTNELINLDATFSVELSDTQTTLTYTAEVQSMALQAIDTAVTNIKKYLS